MGRPEEMSGDDERGRSPGKREEVRIVDIP